MNLTRTHTTLASLIAAGALLAVPATGQAVKQGKGKQARGAQSCEKAHKAAFAARGTLVSVVADDPATPGSEATVTVKVTSANRPARRSGELADQDAAKPGVQAKGATFTVAAGDAYRLRLRGYEGSDTPSEGDKVKIAGRIARTPRKCAPAGTSVADRLGAVDVRRVAIADRDADA